MQKYERILSFLKEKGMQNKPLTERQFSKPFSDLGISKQGTIRHHLDVMCDSGLLRYNAKEDRFYFDSLTPLATLSSTGGGTPPFISGGNIKKRAIDERQPTRKKILAILKRTTEPLHYRVIAAKIGESGKTTNKTLQRMCDEENAPVVKEGAGLYRIAYGLDQLKNLDSQVRFGLHGIKLEGKLSTLIDKKKGALSSMSIESNQIKRYRKRESFKDFLFMGHPVTVTLYECGLVEVFLSCSNSPLSFPDFERFTYYIEGRFNDLVDRKDWMITQWGINADVFNMELDGVKSIKLQVFKDAWFQIYQKSQDMIRIETHGTKKFHMDDVSKIFLMFVQAANASPSAPEPHEEYHPTPSYDHDPAYG